DGSVTGVQTCALPISDDFAVGNRLIWSEHRTLARDALRRAHAKQLGACLNESNPARGASAAVNWEIKPHRIAATRDHHAPLRIRSEERRVGKGRTSRR